MPARERGAAGQRKPKVQKKRRRHWGRRFVGLVVVLAALAAVGQWRWGVLDAGLDRAGVGSREQVGPPPGLHLSAQPRAGKVAATAEPRRLDPAAVRRALVPYLHAHALGGRFEVLVTDLAGRVALHQGSGPVMPASTTKLLTSTAALRTLGPAARFTTSVVRVPGSNRVVLVGGGDPFLASTPKQAAGLYPARATTAQLATRTATALHRAGISRVRLGYDATLFAGPAVDAHWPSTYLPDVVPPISALWVDEARGPDGYVPNPAMVAAATFAGQLRARHVQVSGAVVPQRAPHAAMIARVRSAPLGEIVQRLLTVSDNNAAEVVARHVGLAVRHDGSFVGASAAVRQVLTGLRVPTPGLQLYDGSGLSRQDRIAPVTLAAVLRLAASPAHPQLRDVVTGLPVAAFTGSLSGRYDGVPVTGRGRVRAKTGTLTGVSALAGIATDRTGTPMVFVAMADRVAVPKTLAARAALDRLTAALGACRCGVPSSSGAG